LKEALTLLLLITTNSFCLSQSGDIRGLIINEFTNEPAPRSAVALISGTDTIMQKTDYSGNFAFTDIQFGNYTLRNRNSEFFRTDSTINLINETLSVNLEVTPILGHKRETPTSSVQFEFWAVPTSTLRYSYAFTKDSIKLIQNENTDHIHYCTEEESKEITRLIDKYNLNFASTYEQRITRWMIGWKIDIERAGMRYDLNLPNYHNQGLEELIKYVSSIFPTECKHQFTR